MKRAAAIRAMCFVAFGTPAVLAAAEGVGDALPADSPASSGGGLPLWELGLGVAGLRLPDYRGSDQSRSHLLPLPYLVYRGQWLRADREGARAVLVDTRQLDVDISVGASVPSNSSDNRARQGMPDLPATVEIGPNVNITLLRSADRRLKLDLRLPVRAVFSVTRSPRGEGFTFSPNLNLDIGRVAGGWNLGLLAGPSFGDRRNHALFYDVDAAYATPARPAYRAAGGYEGWRALIATSRRFSSTWVGAFVRYDSLSGAVFADSPLVRRQNGLTLGFGVAWVLGTSAERVPSPD